MYAHTHTLIHVCVYLSTHGCCTPMCVGVCMYTHTWMCMQLRSNHIEPLEFLNSSLFLLSHLTLLNSQSFCTATSTSWDILWPLPFFT